MADNIRKPIPKNQRDISISKQDPLLENPNSSVTPLPRFINPNDPATAKAYRAQQITLKDEPGRTYGIGIQDIDEAVHYYFNNIIKPQVYQNGVLENIPVVYGNPERWKSVQKDGYYRDKNSKIMAPVIMFRRTSMENNFALTNKIDANFPLNYAVVGKGYQKSNTYSRFDLLNNRQPVDSYDIVVVPDYVTLQYDCIVWTYYIEQMNKVIEGINYATNSYWGDPARYKFHARIESFTNNETLNQGEERLIKTNFSITLNGYLVPETINKDIVAARKSFSKGSTIITSEIQSTDT